MNCKKCVTCFWIFKWKKFFKKNCADRHRNAVEQHQARLVLWWVTARENWALWTCVRSSVRILICDRPRDRYHADTDVSQINRPWLPIIIQLLLVPLKILIYKCVLQIRNDVILPSPLFIDILGTDYEWCHFFSSCSIDMFCLRLTGFNLFDVFSSSVISSHDGNMLMVLGWNDPQTSNVRTSKISKTFA